MNILSIDTDKCRRDGNCVETCPLGLIQITREVPADTPKKKSGYHLALNIEINKHPGAGFN